MSVINKFIHALNTAKIYLNTFIFANRPVAAQKLVEKGIKSVAGETCL
jgi:hypothetical protein